MLKVGQDAIVDGIGRIRRCWSGANLKHAFNIEVPGALPGRAMHVTVALWFLAGLHRSRTVRLSNDVLMALHVDRHAKYRALAQLERAGLVSIERRRGVSPMVTLLAIAPVQPP